MNNKAIITDQKNKITRKIVRQWQHTAELLNEIHARELQNLVYDPELVDAFSAILAEENSFSGGHQ